MIPLSKSFFSEWLRKLYSELSDEAYVITGTGSCIEPRTYYRKYMGYLRECELDGHGYTFHALRHTFATEAIRSGMNAKSLSEILGHSGVKITLERYVHPSFEQKKQEMEKAHDVSSIAVMFSVGVSKIARLTGIFHASALKGRTFRTNSADMRRRGFVCLLAIPRGTDMYMTS